MTLKKAAEGPIALELEAVGEGKKGLKPLDPFDAVLMRRCDSEVDPSDDVLADKGELL